MEKRVSERKDVMLGAELVCDKVSYAAVVRNVSEKGISVIISPLKSKTDFIPDKNIELRFPLSSGEPVNLQCRRRWSNRFMPTRLTKIIGMEIIAPPLNYSNFLNTLH